MECVKCEWSWEIETDDMNPYLCHKCGFDDKLNDYDLISLKPALRILLEKKQRYIC